MDKQIIISCIERTAPLSIAAEWDHSGIQVPCLRNQVTKLAVTLDPTPDSIARALASGADMILTHHPLTLSPRFTHDEDSYVSCLRQLLSADVMLYSSHTSLDANPNGPASWFAMALGITSPSVLESTGSMPDSGIEAGFGLVGNIPQTSLAHILALTGCSDARLCGGHTPIPETIHRIAVCPGSGSSLAEEAAKQGAQLFVTGDMKYHAALDAPLPILDVGHFSLENTMIQRFGEQISQELPGLDVIFVPAVDPFTPIHA